MALDDVLRAWSLTKPEFDDFLFDRAVPEDFEALEKAGMSLPAPLRSLYEAHDGGSIFAGNLRLYPLRTALDEDFTVLNLSNRLREWEWQVPAEVLVFAGHSQDDWFGIWTADADRYPIVEVGAIFEDTGPLAVKATSLDAFLTGWSAYYLLLYEADPAALDALGLPDELRVSPDELDDAAEARIWQWADPTLPSHWARDSYKDRFTPDDINRWLRATGPGADS